MKASPKVVVKHVYDVTYNAADFGEESDVRTYITGVDFFAAHYFYAAMLESKPGVLNAEVTRYAVFSDDTRQRMFRVTPANYPAFKRDTLLGLSIKSSEDLSHLIKSDNDAELIAKGIEVGIQRSVSYIQMRAANTDDVTISNLLNEIAEDLLYEAPTSYVKWKSITALALADNVHLKNNSTLKSLAEKVQQSKSLISFDEQIQALLKAIGNLKG